MPKAGSVSGCNNNTSLPDPPVNIVNVISVDEKIKNGVAFHALVINDIIVVAALGENGYLVLLAVQTVDAADCFKSCH